jgi:hypothetical protein
MKAFALEESWEVIRQVLPADLETIARQSGSFQRARKVGDALSLGRLLLMHASGLSLAQTALRAYAQGLGKISAVALFKRLRRSGAFLQQVAVRLLEQVPQRVAQACWPAGYRFRLIDRCDHRHRTGAQGPHLARALQPAAAGVGLRPL